MLRQTGHVIRQRGTQPAIQQDQPGVNPIENSLASDGSAAAVAQLAVGGRSLLS